MTPVSISAAIIERKLCIHIDLIVTTRPLIAAIIQLTDSATHVQATNHKSRAIPFQTVTMTPAAISVTIIALRYLF